jgi:hypothetical protein
MARYQYLALNIDRSEIRLVHLLPGKFEDAVEVELLYRELPEDWNGELSQLHYEALSYVWGPPGNPETNQTITVRESGGWTPRKDVMSTLLAFKNRLFWQPSESKAPEPSRLLSVGQNLGVALRHLRHRNKSRILWYTLGAFHCSIETRHVNVPAVLKYFSGTVLILSPLQDRRHLHQPGRCDRTQSRSWTNGSNLPSSCSSGDLAWS